MTWFLVPIKSTDTSGVKIAKIKHYNMTSAEEHCGLFFLLPNNSTSLFIIRIETTNENPCNIVFSNSPRVIYQSNIDVSPRRLAGRLLICLVDCTRFITTQYITACHFYCFNKSIIISIKWIKTDTCFTNQWN